MLIPSAEERSGVRAQMVQEEYKRFEFLVREHEGYKMYT